MCLAEDPITEEEDDEEGFGKGKIKKREYCMNIHDYYNKPLSIGDLMMEYNYQCPMEEYNYQCPMMEYNYQCPMMEYNYQCPMREHNKTN